MLMRNPPSRSCSGYNDQGEPCRQAPLQSGRFCFWHDPEHAEAARDARRLGGLRRRREGTLAGAYELEGLTSVPQIRRLLEVAGYDLLGLDSTVARARALVSVALAAAKLLEVGELEQRVVLLEAAVQARDVAPVFTVEAEER